MPIRPALRWYYPIDWPQLSRWVRFTRGQGRCQTCRRPHGQKVVCLPDGRWCDLSTGQWTTGRGARCTLPCPVDLLASRRTRVSLAAAHLDHDPAHNRPSNLASLCQRCHMLHDRPHHLAQRRLAYLRRWAIGDLFLGRYAD